MNYLSEITLKIFLCLIHGCESIEIPVMLRTEKQDFIKIYKNLLVDHNSINSQKLT